MVKPERKPKVERKRKTTTRVVPRRPSNFRRLRAANSVEKKKKKKGFEELRDELFHEAAKLVAEDPSQRIAIIIAPPRNSSEPNVPFRSFGYPSAEGVVQQYTAPVPEEEDNEEEEEEDWSKYYWWEDEKLLNSKDPVELMAAMAEMEKLKKQIDMYTSEIGQEDDDDGPKP